MTNLTQRLAAIRSCMKEHGLDFYLVPSIDAHNSEYVPECWQRRTWASGFDGSAGEVLITLEHAYLSTDGRYFLQASQQLDENLYSLIKQTGFVPETEIWLQSNVRCKKLGLDPKLISIGRFQKLQDLITGAGGDLVIIEQNLIDQAKNDLGQEVIVPQNPAMLLDTQYTGMSASEKLTWLRGELSKHNADCIAINVLDEIAWLLNIRGTDIDYNPYVISYAIVSKDKASLFVDKSKIHEPLLNALHDAGVELFDYDEVGCVLSSINGTVWLDDSTVSQWMFNQVVKSANVYTAKSPIVMKKAMKNPVEVEGMRISHRKDAVAMINFFYWLENNWQGHDEISAADKLEWFRNQQEHIQGLSFSTISGYESNGAIIHYRATPDSAKKLGDSSLYLLDSGGQYLEGTTDITRTLHLGEPTAEHKRYYTLVLKGHLALSRAIFVKGTRGDQLDILARAPLWNNFANYRHGTGHGVGCFLGVHEGPQRISQAPSMVALELGMVVSNEPGYYVNGAYGIRIENLCLVTEVNKSEAKNSEYGPFYAFEDLTLVPYCKKLIDVALLSDDDKQQIKNYYQMIREIILPNLGENEANWLINELAVTGI